MSKSQRTKGASYEREVCAALADVLGIPVQRVLGQARDGGGDIMPPGLLVECKRRKALRTFYAWLRQAYAAAGATRIPVVVMRADNEESVLCVPLRFLAPFVASVNNIQETYPRA